MDCGCFKTCEQLSNRLIGLGNSSDSGSAGDDAYLFCGVALIVCLPQRVLAPPTAYIGINDWDKCWWLALAAQKINEPGNIGSGNGVLFGCWVCRNDISDSALRIVDINGNLCGEFAVVSSGQALFNARDHLLKTTCPGHIDPRAHVRDLEVACQPLGIGHLIDIAEVWLCGTSDGCDDLIATGGNGVGVTSNLVQKATSLGEGVVNLVDIRPQLGAARCNTIACAAGWNPAATRDVFEALGCNQRLLDGL